MNLIEQQSAAKDLPMQYLQQAVNGQNPNLTPWIATAELQRRTTMNQHMQPKGPQGPQPTVKDQVEQKAGLMATQAAQQAQAAQAQQSSIPPGPVPAGVPQPEGQPEEPVMAARGGLMEAPINFKFAHGGILGYAGDEDGSYVDPASGMAIQGMPEQDAPAASSGALGMFSSEPEWKKAARARAKGERYIPPPGYDADGLPIKQQAAAPRREVDDRPRRPSLQGQGIKAALPQPAQRPPAPRAAPAAQMPPAPPQEAAAQPDAMGPAGKAALEFSTAPTKERTLEDIIAESRAVRKEAGTDQPMGVDEGAQQARQDDVQKRQQDQAKRLAWAAHVAASVGTPGSESLAYNQTLANALGTEAEYGQQKYKNLAELAAAKRKAAETQQTGLESATAAGRLASAGERKDKAYTAANIYGTQEQAKASKYSADSHAKSAMEIAKLQERGATARQNSSDQKQALAELTQLEKSYDADIKSLESQIRPLVGLLTPDAKAQVKGLTEQLAVARDLKRRVRGDKGAAPAGTMAPDRAAQFKVLRPS